MIIILTLFGWQLVKYPTEEYPELTPTDSLDFLKEATVVSKKIIYHRFYQFQIDNVTKVNWKVPNNLLIPVSSFYDMVKYLIGLDI